MRKIRYKVGKNEDIGCISHGAIITNVYIIKETTNGGEALVYFPKKVEWMLVLDDEIEKGTDIGCGSLGFAQILHERSRESKEKELWERHCDDYINLDNISGRVYESKIKKRK